ncbi:MAG: phosphogluconate dehydratase, partial [Bacteroidota bacterium]
AEGGLIAKIRTGDRLRLDAIKGELICLESDLESREIRMIEYEHNSHGRDLFTKVRSLIENGERGAGII